MENISSSLRGELTRYMLEVKAGVFVGNINTRVAGLLWEKVCKAIDESKVLPGSGSRNAVLIQNTNNEQGYRILTYGYRSYATEDLDGITLIQHLNE